MAHHQLGTWTCPSGNNVVVFLHRDAHALLHINMEWDTPPPLPPADELYYQVEIMPAVNRLVREYTEAVGGPTLWLRP